MASITTLPSLYSICRTNPHLTSTPSSSFSPSLRFLRLQRNSIANPSQYLIPKKSQKMRRIWSVAEETQIPQVEEKEEAPVDQPVSVPVSPSDMLTMFFQAEGIMDESNVPKVTTALKEIEGVNDLKIHIIEGIASVELTKQTTVQATGVASNLVEIIQGSGFKLQTLNLGFEDEETAD